MGEAGQARVPRLGRRANLPTSLVSMMEVSGYLVGSAAFKAVGTGDPRPAGSIPVHLRQSLPRRGAVDEAGSSAHEGSPVDVHPLR